VHAPSEDKSDDSKDSFYEKLEQVFDHFSKYLSKILLGCFKQKCGETKFSKLQLKLKIYIRILMTMVFA